MTTASIFINNSINQDLDDKDQNLISSSIINSNWDPNGDKIEFFIYDELNNLIYTDYNYSDIELIQFNQNNSVSELNLNIESTLNNLGFYNGNIKLVYNFVKYELSSSLYSKYYISEISADRTELRIKSSFISSSLSYNNSQYFDELYLNFGSNKYSIITNIEIDEDSILVKLYEPLEIDIEVKTELYIVSKPAESLSFNVIFPTEYEPIFYTKLKGPNYSINNDGISTTLYQNEQEILSTSLTSSYSQLKNIINSKKLGVDLYTDYFNFDSFIKFSSAYQRLLNFTTKVSSIEDYRLEINTLNAITGSYSSSVGISSSLATLYNNIQNIISNFDNYEYYLYFDSSSYSWPKSNTSPPYTLYSTASSQVSTWLGSIIENSPVYGGMLLSASIFDDQNQDNLVNVIPEFIREDNENYNYILFSNMVGQFFDDIWLYAKYITQKYRNDNRLNYGSPKDLVDEILESLGIELFKNQKFSENIYNSYIGIGVSGSLLYPTSSNELITELVDVNSGSFVPFNIIDIDKELYKRLYHNLIQLLKKKGTIQGLKELINLYGIPSTILRINEFGQRNTNPDEDYFQNTFNYAYYIDRPPTGSFSGVRIPWRTLESATIKPNAIAFRFKPKAVNTIVNYSQSLFYMGQMAGGEPNPIKMYMVIEYTGSLQSGSYSGSILDPFHKWAHVKLYLSESTNQSASIFAPIFNGNWWSVLLNKESDKITFHLKSKYDQLLDNVIYFENSASITSLTGSWDTPNAVANRSVLRLGVGNITGSNGTNYNFFEGYYQEFRYYSSSLDIASFNSYVLNPLSLESGYLNSYNNLIFRAPLGADLMVSNYDLTRLSSTPLGTEYDLISMHPATTGSSPTSSFPSTLTAGVNRYTLPEVALFNISWSFEPNTEYVYLKEPIVGLNNRINNKIQIEDTIIPSGSTLSNLLSLQQSDNYYRKDANILEIVFSPQDEINDDISQQLGNFNFGDFINHETMYSSSYPGLKIIRDNYFKKYIKPYNIWDYFRLLKYYDNSLFKQLKNFVPLNTNLDSGILVKSHLLERPKYSISRPLFEDHNYYTASINIGSITGSYGTGLEENPFINAVVINTNDTSDFNGLYLSANIPPVVKYVKYSSSLEASFNEGNGVVILQSGAEWVISSASADFYFGILSSSNIIYPWQTPWPEGVEVRQATVYDIQTWTGLNYNSLGIIPYDHNTLDELINGEFSGSNIVSVTQSLIPNQEILSYPDEEIYYQISLFNTSGTHYASDFFDVNLAPVSGEIYVLYDAGILFNPPGLEL